MVLHEHIVLHDLEKAWKYSSSYRIDEIQINTSGMTVCNSTCLKAWESQLRTN